MQREHANSVAALERLRADDAAKHERVTTKVNECEDALRRRDVDALAQGEKLAALQTEFEKMKTAKAQVESDPSFKIGRTILAPFRFFSQKTNSPKPLPRPRE